MIVIVAPGQGSQTPGFLEPWLDLEGAREQLGAISDAVGIDLVAHGTTSDADTIRDTKVAQPLIVAAGLLTLSSLFADGRREKVGGVAGHSVGEVTAAAAAGILSDTDAVAFVRERGRAMADAAALEPTGMSAVLGGDEAALLERLAELDLFPANFNGGGQLVVAGALPALA
ncbi:MAG TPA: ACP S-malonyltransferase, partial [Rhodoglobus sp.]|nr:ACP S-malonyltransferase [Rhodoglobus sp.]